jgi:hypothetical protein
MIGAERPAAPVDTERFRLRTFFDGLPPEGIERHPEYPYIDGFPDSIRMAATPIG